MRRVGEVVRSSQGLAVLRSSDASAPDFGTVVVDENLTEIGRIVDIFGPVDSPYVAVSPETDTPARLLGDVLYARD